MTICCCVWRWNHQADDDEEDDDDYNNDAALCDITLSIMTGEKRNLSSAAEHFRAFNFTQSFYF